MLYCNLACMYVYKMYEKYEFVFMVRSDSKRSPLVG